MRKWLLVGSMCAVLSISGCSGGDDSGTSAGSEQKAATGSEPEPSAGSEQKAATGSEPEATAGGEQSAITGKWRGPKGNAANETFEFRADGTVSLSSDGLNCRGAYEPKDQERVYSFQVSCGDGAFRSTAVVSPDGKTLTLTDPQGEKNDYARVSG